MQIAWGLFVWYGLENNSDLLASRDYSRGFLPFQCNAFISCIITKGAYAQDNDDKRHYFSTAQIFGSSDTLVIAKTHGTIIRLHMFPKNGPGNDLLCHDPSRLCLSPCILLTRRLSWIQLHGATMDEWWKISKRQHKQQAHCTKLRRCLLSSRTEQRA
jgi:hypothetical protein